MSDLGLVLLDDAAVRRMTKAVGSDLPLLVYLGEWLTHLNVFSDAQVYDILRFVKSGIEQATTLAVADSRWVSFSGNRTFLDTHTSEEVDELPAYAVTHIICDIRALQARMEHRQGRFHANQRNGDTAPAVHDQTGGSRANIPTGGTASGSAGIPAL